MALIYTCLAIFIGLFIADLVFKLVTVAMWIGFFALIPFIFKVIHAIIKKK